MAPGENMMEHINKLKSLAEQLESVEEPVLDDDQVATLLCSLPDSYSKLIVVLESRVVDLNMEFVTARLLHEEGKRNESLANSMEIPEKAMISVKAKAQSRDQRVMSSPFKGKGECFNCGIAGHVARDCTKPKRQKFFIEKVSIQMQVVQR